MLGRLRRWRDRRYLERVRIDDALWLQAASLPACAHLGPEALALLRRAATLLLRDKSFYGAHAFAVDDWIRVRIAAEACLPALYLDGPRYRDFDSIVVYDSSFLARHYEHDAAGLVRETETELSGESWDRGPLLLSWADIDAPDDPAANIVLHEFAHKLDGEDGILNGRPPLPRTMRGADWHDAFNTAFVDLGRRVHSADVHQRAVRSDVDPYGAEAPEEFFAVCMEAFFMAPHALRAQYPRVYAQLQQWLQQSPHERAAPDTAGAVGTPADGARDGAD